MRSIPVGSRSWIAALAALTATTALSIDMSLPAQPTIARDFGVPPETAQLTLAVFLAAFAIGQLGFGFVSDSIGRKRVLVAGLGAFTVGGVLCAVSTSMPTLLAARALQGLGAAGGPVVARAMVRDTQPVTSAARILATMVAALAVAPMVAPLIGGALLATVGWHAIFIGLAIVGVAMLWLAGALGETRPPEHRVPLVPAGLFAAIRTFAATPGTRVPTALVCVGFAGQFAFISASPFVFIEHYGASELGFAACFACVALALMAGAVTGRRLLLERAPGGVALIGTVLACGGGAVAAAVAWSDRLGPVGLLAPMMIYFVGIGVANSPAIALAMEPVPRIAGTASAVIGALQMVCGAGAGWLVTRIGGSDPRALATTAALAGAIMVVLARAAYAPRPGAAAA